MPDNVFSVNAEFVVSEDEWLSTRLTLEIAPDGDLVEREEESLSATVRYQGVTARLLFVGDIVDLIKSPTYAYDGTPEIHERFFADDGQPTDFGKAFAQRAEEMLWLLRQYPNTFLRSHEEVLKRTIAKYQLRLAAVQNKLKELGDEPEPTTNAD